MDAPRRWRALVVTALLLVTAAACSSGGGDSGSQATPDGQSSDDTPGDAPTVAELLVSLKVGECVNHRGNTIDPAKMDFRVVDCTEPHRFEVTSTSFLREHGIEGAYDRTALDRVGHEICIPAFEDYAGVEESISFTDGYLVPNAGDWSHESARRLVCTASSIVGEIDVAVADAEHAAPTTTRPTVAVPEVAGAWTSANGENVVTIAADGAFSAIFPSIRMECTGGRITNRLDTDFYVVISATDIACLVGGAEHGEPRVSLNWYAEEGRMHIDYLPLSDDHYENQCVRIFEDEDANCELRLG